MKKRKRMAVETKVNSANIKLKKRKATDAIERIEAEH